jgi:hypothetical protein
MNWTAAAHCYSGNCGFLSVSPASGSNSGTVVASINAAGLSPGTYTNEAVWISANTVASVPVSLTVVAASGPSITTTSLPEGSLGNGYSATLQASGGSGSYTWSISGGSLPAGLTLTPSTGAISGTPTAAGTSNFTVQVKDSNSNTATANLSLSVLGITTTSLPPGTVGTYYSAPLAATGGSGSYTWSIANGSPALPSGLSLIASTGVISGTPTPTGVGTPTITYQVTDSSSRTATANLVLTINPAPSSLTITTASLPSGVVGVAYTTTTLAATGGSGTYTWSVTGLPPGLTFNATNLQITGTPNTAAGSPYGVSVSVTDTSSPQQHASQTYQVPIYILLSGFTPTSLPAGTVGTAYSQSVSVTGGTAPYTWSATGLPSGLGMNASSGLISGTPANNTGSPFGVTVSVKDSSSPQQQGNQNYSLVISGAPTSYTVSGTVQNGSAGVAGVLITATNTATGVQAGSTTTGATGTYSLSLPANVSYTVAASYCGDTFSAPSPWGSGSLTSNETANFSVSGTAPTREYIRLGGRVIAIANCGAQ